MAGRHPGRRHLVCASAAVTRPDGRADRHAARHADSTPDVLSGKRPGTETRLPTAKNLPTREGVIRCAHGNPFSTTSRTTLRFPAMTKLSQIIAVEKGVKSDATRRVTDLHRDVQKQPLLSGISRSYRPRDEEGDHLPPESTRVQVKADDVLAEAAQVLTRLFDVTLTKDTANCTAAADVAVNGKVLLKKVPVTYLLFLEKQLTDVHTFVAKLPLLDPAEDWEDAIDPVTGCWKTRPVQTVRSKKVPRNHQVAAATPQHPEQVQVYTEDVPVGDWTTVKFSGALPATRVRQLLDRVEELQRAVKYAREEANGTEVSDRHAGEIIFGYLFAA